MESSEIAFAVLDDAHIVQNVGGVRLKIAIYFRRDSSDSLTPLGVELVKGGLSFLTPISRESVGRNFINAERHAKINTLGLYSIATSEFVEFVGPTCI